jgi:hypothetical protein
MRKPLEVFGEDVSGQLARPITTLYVAAIVAPTRERTSHRVGSAGIAHEN